LQGGSLVRNLEFLPSRTTGASRPGMSAVRAQTKAKVEWPVRYLLVFAGHDSMLP